MEEYKGKVVLLDFWGTFCGPCIAEFPGLKETYAEYKDKGFEIIGISADDAKEQVDEFQKEFNLPWKLAMSNSDELATAERYSVTMFPSTYLIDREGNVIAVDLGGDELKRAIKAQFE
ncbi:MAG: TlpA disulfide reductase family protein [Planctomycetaceae bacterium]